MSWSFPSSSQAPDDLRRGGHPAGMRMLDLGCGAGDVTFVAADLVGPGGSAVGVDRSPEALARARLRAGQRGLTHVLFIEGDIDEPAPGGPFNAIVERLALWLVSDPAAVLRRQATVLRPGGLVVLIEFDLSPDPVLPETAYVTQFKSWLVEAFARAGMSMLGPRLWAVVREAGLRPLGMIGVQPHFGPGDEVGRAYLVESLRVAAPLIVAPEWPPPRRSACRRLSNG